MILSECDLLMCFFVCGTACGWTRSLIPHTHSHPRSLSSLPSLLAHLLHQVADPTTTTSGCSRLGLCSRRCLLSLSLFSLLTLSSEVRMPFSLSLSLCEYACIWLCVAFVSHCLAVTLTHSHSLSLLLAYLHCGVVLCSLSLTYSIFRLFDSLTLSCQFRLDDRLNDNTATSLACSHLRQ